MSIIETAKDLLRKGIALNDEELIQMANSLLAGQELLPMILWSKESSQRRREFL